MDEIESFEESFDPMVTWKTSDHYQKKYLKKNHCQRYRSRCHLGNARSLSASRPSGHVLCTRRLAEKTISLDTQRHQTIDHHPIEVPYMYRKTSIQTIVSYQDKPRTNTVKCTTTVPSQGQRPLPYPKIIHLDAIDPNLYLGNRLAAEDEGFLSNHKIHLIINLSNHLLDNKGPSHRQVYNIRYPDNRSLNYHQWKTIVNQVISLIQDNTRNLLIVCDKGVNRSVSMAIAYAMIHKGMTYDHSREYIEEKKNKKYQHFNNLTNPRICNLLKALNSQLFSKKGN